MNTSYFLSHRSYVTPQNDNKIYPSLIYITHGHTHTHNLFNACKRHTKLLKSFSVVSHVTMRYLLLVLQLQIYISLFVSELYSHNHGVGIF